MNLLTHWLSEYVGKTNYHRFRELYTLGLAASMDPTIELHIVTSCPFNRGPGGFINITLYPLHSTSTLHIVLYNYSERGHLWDASIKKILGDTRRITMLGQWLCWSVDACEDVL